MVRGSGRTIAKLDTRTPKNGNVKLVGRYFEIASFFTVVRQQPLSFICTYLNEEKLRLRPGNAKNVSSYHRLDSKSRLCPHTRSDHVMRRVTTPSALHGDPCQQPR
jgi:hypothetical protein